MREERREERARGVVGGKSQSVMHARIGAFDTCQRPVAIEIYFRDFWFAFEKFRPAKS